MKTEENIKKEIERLELLALDRIREGYTNFKYELVFRLKTLRWVLENEGT